MYGLLMAPEPDDPLDRYEDICIPIKYLSFISVLAEEYHTDKEQYMRKARELTQQKASQITWEEYKTVT